MVVGIAVFEIHIPHAQSLKEKRAVVKRLRDRIRHRFEVSTAEVALQELHQRARLGVAVISSSHETVSRILESVLSFADENVDGRILGSTREIMSFDAGGPLDLPAQGEEFDFGTEE
jgi:uncharacterized protein